MGREIEAVRTWTEVVGMKNADELARENQALRQRLSRLSEASLRIKESLDLRDGVAGVLDSARWLTGARYGGHHPPGRRWADTGLPLFRADSRGEPAVRRISQRYALLRAAQQHQ